MSDSDDEKVSTLKVQVAQLRSDFYEHAKETNTSLRKIFEFISEYLGAQKERDKNADTRNQAAELSATKIMAAAAVAGVIAATVQQVFHSLH
jgi:hypothetical protein